jgi:hypothetical protein
MTGPPPLAGNIAALGGRGPAPTGGRAVWHRERPAVAASDLGGPAELAHVKMVEGYRSLGAGASSPPRQNARPDRGRCLLPGGGRGCDRRQKLSGAPSSG